MYVNYLYNVVWNPCMYIIHTNSLLAASIFYVNLEKDLSGQYDLLEFPLFSSSLS